MQNIDRKFMLEAIKTAEKAHKSFKAFSVGAVITAGTEIVCTGYSRETGDSMHAEEVCLAKIKDLNLDHCKLVLYSTMEPCGERLSGKKCCAELIIESKIPKVVIGALEPDTFIKNTRGIAKLKSHNIKVISIADMNGMCFIFYES